MPDKICNACIKKLSQSYDFYRSFRSCNAIRGIQKILNTYKDEETLQSLILQPFRDCSLQCPLPTHKKEDDKNCSMELPVVELKTEYVPPKKVAEEEVKPKEEVKPERNPKKFRTKLVCEYCGKFFKHNHSIIRHKRAIHPD